MWWQRAFPRRPAKLRSRRRRDNSPIYRLPSVGRPVFAAPRRVYRSERALHGHPVTRARSARQYVDGADEYFAMARVSEEVGRLLYGLREDLDDIDSRAHEDIQRIQQSMGVGKAVQAGVQIMAIVTKARTEATARAGEACVGRFWRPSRRGAGDAVRNVSGVAGQ